MKNQVIKNLTPEMGKEIIKYWQDKGVDTRVLTGYFCESNGYECIYYGVINGTFKNYYLEQVQQANAEIIELPTTTQELGWQGENTKHVEVTQTDENLTVSFKIQTKAYPELPEINFDGIEMEVKNDVHGYWHYKVVVAKVNDKYLAKDGYFWTYARSITKKVKVTMKEVAEAFNTTVDNLEIEP